jgi:4,5-dihydroxyphthalate decarboxylase
MSKDKKTDNVDHDFSRRGFIRATGMAAGAVSTVVASSGIFAADTSMPKPSGKGLPLKLAGYSFDRLEALMAGKVEIEGCNSQFSLGKIGDMNADTFGGAQTADVTEIGLHPFMLAYANDNFRDYTLLPVFPLRTFRHKSVFVRKDSGITKPEDLRGKRIGSPSYSSTSLTWLRGVFQDEYGISPKDVKWVMTAKDSSAGTDGKISKQEAFVPVGISMEWGEPGKDESDLLLSGDIDAIFHAIEPKAYVDGHPNIGRLFADPKAVERAYYKKTGIFPIMHTVAIRRSLLEEHPWLAEAVFNAYSKSKHMAYKKMINLGWAMNSLPWFGQELEETRALMGDDFYSYGIEDNRKSLEALFRYSYEQGLASKELTIEELFAASSLKLAG